MSQTQIRLTRTSDINKVLSFLRSKYQLLSEADIIKLALSEKYQEEKEETMEKERKLREAYNHAMEEGKKVGIKLMKGKGLDPKKVTEQQFYEIFLDTHKHNA
ncbi:hypothetical protein A3I48_01375 [Candidatus Daviesbacteria bacterium RIFCSPLOWO2_02_FULL_36_7]|uniref:Uncharacterized protein n=1 Tax=Candidatus Daviesbacteria bacterium RIFCSPLOWO2_02_FULL_36_7 TaxID=1797792 RepID=A0A1F5MI92_9BACT|nr:MAG: hypothetical protein A3I48_01375 [Candidatus Daviesbacteria bacterium RIFCSPLOWO2_02_FULL_36_7]